MLASNESSHVALDTKNGATIVRVLTGFAFSFDRNMPAETRQKLYDVGYSATADAVKSLQTAPPKTNQASMRLGCKPAAPRPVTPHLMKHIMVGQPKPAVDRRKAVKAWHCLGKDRRGCCTAAAAFHIAQTWLANNGFDLQPTEDATLALYSATSDFPKEDDAAVESRVLAYWCATGIPTNIGTEKIASATLAPTNLNELKLSIEYFGAAYIGVNLPISAQTQEVWDVPSGGAVGDGAPGSWGGHAVPLLAYDEKSFTCVSWGKPLTMSNAFVQAYCEEAYTLISWDWLADSGISPPGLNMAALQAEPRAIIG